MLFVELCHGMAGQRGDKPLIEEDYPERREKSGRTRPRPLPPHHPNSVHFVCPALSPPSALAWSFPICSLFSKGSRGFLPRTSMWTPALSLSTCTLSQRLSASGPVRIVLERTWSQPFSAPFHNPSLVGVVPLCITCTILYFVLV